MLLVDWCKANGEFGQQVLSEWTGLTEDGKPKDLDSTTHGSGIKMQWKCTKCSHVWLAKPNSRTANRNGCPMCYEANRSKLSGKARTTPGVDDLKTWCLNNGELGEKILNEWAGIDAKGDEISIDSVKPQSNKRVQWICSKNNKHIWEAVIQKRVLLHSGCPYCANQRVMSGENDLETWCKNNDKQYLIEQFVGKLEDGTPVLMNTLPKATPKKVWWKHITEDGDVHKWKAAVSDRTANNSGCPLCTGMNNLKPGINDLETWCNENPIFGEIIRKQWVGKDINGNSVEMKDITCKSHTKLLWTCPKCGEQYPRSPLKKIYNRSIVCNACNITGTSFPEQLLYRCIKQVYPNTISRGKFMGYEYDITIPELRTCIEYGSYFYHKDKTQRDLEKKELCEKHGVRFINVLDSTSSDIPDILEDNNIIMSIKDDNALRTMIYLVLKTLNIDDKEVDYDRAYIDSLEFMQG